MDNFEFLQPDSFFAERIKRESEFNLLAQAKQFVDLWESSPTLRSVTQWDSVLDTFFRDFPEDQARRQARWFNRRVYSEEYAGAMMLAMLNGIHEFIYTRIPRDGAIFKETVKLIRLIAAMIIQNLGSTKAQEENRDEVAREMRNLMNFLQESFFGNYANTVYTDAHGREVPSLELHEAFTTERRRFRDHLFDLHAHISASLSALRSLNRHYAASGNDGAKGVRSAGKILAIVGGVSAVAGFGAGPLLGALADKGFEHIAKKYFDPSPEALRVREDLHEKIQFVLSGDTTNENGGAIPPCSREMTYHYPVEHVGIDKSFEMAPRVFHWKLDANGRPLRNDEKFLKDFISIRDAGLCDSGIKRFERIEYAFNLLNVLRQSQIRFSQKYNPSSGGAADNDYYFPNGIAKTSYSGWIEALWPEPHQIPSPYKPFVAKSLELKLELEDLLRRGNTRLPEDPQPKAVVSQVQEYLNTYKNVKQMLNMMPNGGGSFVEAMSSLENLGGTIYGTPGGMISIKTVTTEGGEVEEATATAWGSVSALWGG